MTAGLDLRALGILTLCAILTALGLFVLWRDPNRLVNRLFALAMLTITGWIGSIATALSARDPQVGLWGGRMAFAFASAIPFSLHWMFDALANPSPRRIRLRILVPGLCCSAFIFLSLSPLIVAGWTHDFPRASLVYGPLHPLFAIYFIATFSYALYTLSRSIRAASGLRKLQLRYLLLGILLGGAGAITTNLLIPLVWQTSRYSLLGPYFSLIVALCSAHAIIRYRLLDIRVVIRNGVVYASALVVAAGIVVALGAAASALTGHGGHISLGMALTLAAGAAISFGPLKSLVQRALNRYLYRQAYDFHRTLREASRRLSTILEIDALLATLIDVLERTFQAETVAIYLSDDPSGPLLRQDVRRPRALQNGRSEGLISRGSRLVRCLDRRGRLLVREEALLSPPGSLEHAAAQEMTGLGAEVALALQEDGGVFGVVLVGPKRSGDPYFSDDIDLLWTLVSQASVALKNAQLYRQVVVVNEYVENILGTMDSAVVAVSADGRITLSNDAASRLTGLSPSHLKTGSLSVLPAPIADLLRATLDDRQPRSQVETRFYDGAGRLVPVMCSTSPLIDRTRSTLGAVAVFSDLTRLKQLEEEKRRVEQLATVGALASGLAHEIKNPLVAIRTFAELLPERFSDADFRNEFAQIVTREIERIDGLVARLRDLAAPPPPSFRPLDIRLPIDETLALVRPQLERRRIRAETSYDHGPLRIAGDPAQLKQLFLNLFLNAIDAMEDGGRLIIRVRGHYGADPILVVEIADTGTGIPGQVIDRIFDPFVTTKEGGSGLGLSICRSIADAHRARIAARNNVGAAGATVTVEFPVLPFSPSPEDLARAAADPR